MKKLLLLSFTVVALSFAFSRDAQVQTEPQIGVAELRLASAKAINRIQQAQTVWYQKQTCTSCHHQLLPEIMLKLARERGVPVNETIAREMTKASFARLSDLDMAVQGYDYIDVFFDGWVLISASRAGVKPNLTTSAYSQFIASRQQPDGSWPTIDARPPQAHSPFAATAVCAEAMQWYLPARFKSEQETRLRQAREWLLKSPARTTEDLTYQLLGLFWTGADAKARQKTARQLLSEQRADGGWAQLPALDSDAYSTGEVLFALREGAGISTKEPAYQRGLRYLLKTQQPDGSWRIKSRLHPPAPVSPPYVDSEFPEGHDQFISIMGTSWAVNAMLQAIPAKAGGKLDQPDPTNLLDLAPMVEAGRVDWERVTLNGSAAELKKLLDAKMSPNAKTTAGTTALMLAARDPEKVKLLLARGAEVNAQAETGITVLMIAARYKGNAEVVKLLLQKGAKPNVEAKVQNNASALFYAITAGDVQTADLLIAAGAKLDNRMTLLGQFQIWPMTFAALGDEAGLVDFLIGKGANVNEVDDDGLSALAWATLTNHVQTIQVLLARGAKVDQVDKFGMTPLLYAASVYYGDTAVLEKLIGAGADLKAKNKQGQTALDLARIFNHANAASLLSSKIALR
jgi:ankyrin repeat protein